jgi:hypothetical protein
MAGWLGEHDDAHCREEREHDYLAEVSRLALRIGEVHLCECEGHEFSSVHTNKTF